MFARPYALADRPPSATSTPRKAAAASKAFQLFRTLPGAVSVPATPVLAYSYAASPRHLTNRPASATPYATPDATNTVHGVYAQPFSHANTPAAAAASQPGTARAAVASPRPPPSPRSRPTTAGSASARYHRRGGSEYQAVFLSALDARHKTEADRLTLFNRVQHLRAAEERAERAVLHTKEQIARVEVARRRHAAESAQRAAAQRAQNEHRLEAAQAQRSAQAARRAAYADYKRDLVRLRKEQAAQQRDVHSELIAHRNAMAEEDLKKFQIVRADIQDRHRLFHERNELQRQADIERRRQQKAWKILVEEQRRIAAEQDLVRMQEEEQALLERAERTRREHAQAVDHLAALVLVDTKLPTARSRYDTIAALQGRVSPRKNRPTSATTSATTTPQPPPHTGLYLSMPTPGMQQRIHHPHAQPSPPASTRSRQGDEEKENVSSAPPRSSAFDDDEPDAADSDVDANSDGHVSDEDPAHALTDDVTHSPQLNHSGSDSDYPPAAAAIDDMLADTDASQPHDE